MASLNINNDEQLIKILSIKKVGTYFNVFCFNRSNNKSSTYKGAKNCDEILAFIDVSCQQGVISKSLLKTINLSELIDKLTASREGEDINVEV